MFKSNNTAASSDNSIRLQKNIITNIIKFIIAAGLLTFVILKINFSEVCFSFFESILTIYQMEFDNKNNTES